MNMKFFVAAALSVSAAFTATTSIAADIAAGKAKSVMCASCHGADGNSVNPDWPKLAGQHANYVAKQLADFKKGEDRNNALMAGMVAGLTPEDMANLAAYYAGLK